MPPSWVIEFSDPVFGNRWTADHIHLSVQGRACNLKSVSSQHDRRFVWAGSEYYGYLDLLYGAEELVTAHIRTCRQFRAVAKNSRAYS